MWIKTGMLFLATALPLGAQQPLSAIDWLSKSVQEKQPEAVLTPQRVEPQTPSEITVTTLDEISKDTVGLLPTAVSGLPRDFWGASSTYTIADLISQQRTDSLPELLTLLYRILLAEVDAPEADAARPVLLLARIDKLLDLGALEQAQALIERAGPTEADIFRRWFDVSLLTGHEDFACAAMSASPGFAPTMQARVFCLARNGDWNAAALTLATGTVLGLISESEADLLERFLDPSLFENEPDIPAPNPLTPLVFTMREAIAMPRPSGTLPLAFANIDLKRSAAWRTQLEAAERLSRTQALDPHRLINLYTQKRPAATGGVWNRVEAVQAFDVALLAGDLAKIENALPAAYRAMEQISLEVTFAEYFEPRLSPLQLSGVASQICFKIALLSSDYESSPKNIEPGNQKNQFLLGLAKGDVAGLTPPGALGQAIAAAFLAPPPPSELLDLLTEHKIGEAVLRAMILMKNEAFADPGDITAALSTFRAVGLEQEARRVALQMLLLERRG
jgi:hypothetical protein